MRIIKRYSNRRLYDLQTSSTIKQSDVAGMIKRGIEVRIIDSSSGNDITTLVLGRILLAETENWVDNNESKNFLTHIIELGGKHSMSILKNTVLASIGAFQVTKAKAEKIIDDLIKKGDLNESDRKKAVMELLDKAEKSTANIRDKVTVEVNKAQKEISKFASEVKQYKLVKQDDIKKLETKVDKLTKLVKSLEKKLADK